MPAALIYGVILYLLIWLPREPTIPFIVGLIFFPMAIGSVVTILMDPRGEGSTRRHIRAGWIGITALIALSIVMFREGGICVAMAAPFFYAGSALGAWLSGLALRKLRSRSGASCIAILPLIAIPIPSPLPAPQHDGQVRTVIRIDAPPSLVWKKTVEIPDIQSGERMWTFSHNIIGVPVPLDARIAGHGIGAVRHLRWSRGVVFEEIVTAWQQDHLLSWTFRFGPHSIPDSVEGHIRVDSGYLRLLGGDYRLDALPDHRTQLTLTTRYRIATPINGYCDLWGRLFLDDFHGAVLHIIRKRAEAEARDPSARQGTVHSEKTFPGLPLPPGKANYPIELRAQERMPS